MWCSFLMTRLTSSQPICKVRHSQEKKGDQYLAFCSSSRLMCFLKIQNLDVKPPNMKPVISSILQDVVDFSNLKLGSSSYKSRKRNCSFKLTRFFFLRDLFLMMALTPGIFPSSELNVSVSSAAYSSKQSSFVSIGSFTIFLHIISISEPSGDNRIQLSTQLEFQTIYSVEQLYLKHFRQFLEYSSTISLISSVFLSLSSIWILAF